MGPVADCYLTTASQGALGLHRLVAMDVRQPVRVKKEPPPLPGAVHSGLHICALCRRRAETPQPVNENMEPSETHGPTEGMRG